MSPQTGTPRRTRLERLLRYFLLLFFIAFMWIALRFVFSGATTPPDLPTLRVPIDDLAVGQHKLIDWEGRPVLILRRSDSMQAALRDTQVGLLHDPVGEKSTQPAVVMQGWRSRDPEWFVVIAVGTDLGCPVRLAESQELPVGLPAGLRDTCRGSFYDLAGRVLRGQHAEENLTIPSYRVDEAVVVLGAL